MDPEFENCLKRGKINPMFHSARALIYEKIIEKEATTAYDLLECAKELLNKAGEILKQRI